jgi:hypothetical protein
MGEPAVRSVEAEHLEITELGRGASCIVRLGNGSGAGGEMAAVKAPHCTDGEERLLREVAIHKNVNHSTVIAFRQFRLRTDFKMPAIVMEFAGNEALSNHLPVGKGRLKGANRITKMIAGIVLAMRYCIHAESPIAIYGRTIKLLKLQIAILDTIALF